MNKVGINPETITPAPRTERKRQYVEALSDPQVKLMAVTGPPGCGKTMFAIKVALEALTKGYITDIVLDYS